MRFFLIYTEATKTNTTVLLARRSVVVGYHDDRVFCSYGTVMSARSAPPLDPNLVTVFEGSPPEDVSHARQLWSSLSLLPPQESRLVSGNISQRLPLSRPQARSSTTQLSAEPPSVASLQQRQQERQRYVLLADQRKEILELLRRQRERRIQKELISAAFRPQKKPGEDRRSESRQEMETRRDKEMVLQLQLQ